MCKADILNFIFRSKTTVFVSIYFCNYNGLLQYSKIGRCFVQLQGTFVRVLRDVTFKNIYYPIKQANEKCPFVGEKF